MNENNAYQRKKIDISKTSANTADYHNNSCYRNTAAPTAMPYANTYSNYNAPCVSGVPGWYEFNDDLRELRECLEYLDKHKKWFEKNDKFLRIYDTSIDLLNQLCFMQNTSMNNISNYSSKTKYYISELQKMKSLIYNSENTSTKRIAKEFVSYMLVAFIVFYIASRFVSPIFTWFILTIPVFILEFKYGNRKDSNDPFAYDIFNDFLFK